MAPISNVSSRADHQIKKIDEQESMFVMAVDSSWMDYGDS